MKIQNLYKGFSSFDAILSIVPLIFMLVFLLNVSIVTTKSASERMHRQQLFDKLVSIADYTVKIGAVKRADDLHYPNWVEPKHLTHSYIEDLRVRADLADLYISTKEPDDYEMCIYRLIVLGDDKKISRLFVCGG